MGRRTVVAGRHRCQILQRRISQNCQAGEAIRAIAADGTVSCEAGDVGAGGPPTGSAGGDLAGPNYPNPTIADAAVTMPKLADLAVVTGKLADGAVTSLKVFDNTLR